MSNSTPGPWVRDNGCDAGWLRDGNKKALAYICICNDCTNNRPLHEREANARLIVDAPELLTALEEVAEGEGVFDRDPLIHATNCIEDMKSIAIAAIQKVATKETAPGSSQPEAAITHSTLTDQHTHPC